MIILSLAISSTTPNFFILSFDSKSGRSIGTTNVSNGKFLPHSSTGRIKWLTDSIAFPSPKRNVIFELVSSTSFSFSLDSDDRKLSSHISPHRLLTAPVSIRAFLNVSFILNCSFSDWNITLWTSRCGQRSIKCFIELHSSHLIISPVFLSTMLLPELFDP